MKSVEQIVNEIRSYIESACSDIAYENASAFAENKDAFWISQEIRDKLVKAKVEGVTDLAGWLADEYYNDVGFLTDFIGDRVYDACSGNAEKRNEILSKLGAKPTPLIVN